MNYKINQQLNCVFCPSLSLYFDLRSLQVKHNGQCDLGNQTKRNRSKQVRSFNDRIVPKSSARPYLGTAVLGACYHADANISMITRSRRCWHVDLLAGMMFIVVTSFLSHIATLIYANTKYGRGWWECFRVRIELWRHQMTSHRITSVMLY